MRVTRRSLSVTLLTVVATVLPKIYPRIVFVMVVSLVVTWLHREAYFTDEILTPLPFTLIGLALGIFLGFRNNSSYDRFWEGRKQWGALVNYARTLARRILTLVEPEGGPAPDVIQRKLVHATMGFVHALRLHLRGQTDWAEMRHFLDPELVAQLENESNRPNAITQWMGERIAELWRAGRVDSLHLPTLEDGLTQLTNIQGACERILNTPIPFSYSVLIHRLTIFYCVALPFGIVHTTQAYTPIVVFMVSYAFFGLDSIGDEIEEPFGEDPNDLPLSQLSRMIEVNLYERLGETPPRPFIKPDARDILS